MEARLDPKRKKEAAELVRRKWRLPKDAEVEFHEVEASKPCKHYFVRVSGRTIECRKCRWGLIIDPKERIIDGHLYLDNKKVI